MHAERSSPNEKKRIVPRLITAAFLVWLLRKVRFSLTPMLAQSLITPMP